MDQKLIARASQEDAQAFCELVSACQAKVFRLCYFYAGNGEAAYNLATDSFQKVRNAIPLYPDSEDFHLWLIRIVCNTCRESRARKGESIPVLSAILRTKMDFSEADTAYVLDLKEGDPKLAADDACGLSGLSEPASTPDLAAGFRKSLKAEKKQQSPLKFLAHFRFTILAILIVLIMLLAAHMRSGSSGHQSAASAENSRSVQEEAVTADTAGQFLPGQAASSES